MTVPSFVTLGDPHAQISNLEDLSKVIDLLLEESKKKGVKNLVILGDMFHTHAVLRLEVVNFWQTKLESLSYFDHVIALAGNHDMAGDRQKEGKMSALDTIKGVKNFYPIHSPVKMLDIGFLPYMSSPEAFVTAANSLKDCKVLICHQTFDGSQFENGFYAPSGVDQNLISPEIEQIVSGHIHKGQTIGRVFYPGTPKWDSSSDANETKGFWFFESGARSFVDSSLVIEPIRKILVTPETDLTDLNIGPKTTLELTGPSSWISQVCKTYKGKCKISVRPTDSVERRRLKKEVTNIFDFLADYAGVSNKEKVKSYLENMKNGTG